MLQIDPEYAPALLRLGLVYNFAGRYAEAAQFLRRGVERDSANAAAHELLAEALYGEQKYEEAAVSAEHALKLSPNHRDALYFAGLARASLGQREAALAHLEKLRQLNSPELTKQLLGLHQPESTGLSSERKGKEDGSSARIWTVLNPGLRFAQSNVTP